MNGNVLVRLFEHNQWANLQIIQACASLSDEQLDAEPRSVTKGTIRDTLVHLVSAQRGYLATLTLPVEERPKGPVEYADLEESLRVSGEGLIALARDEGGLPEGSLRTNSGNLTEPWVVMLQVINHAGEHREQIKSMLSDLGITPPDLDGWDYGVASGGLVVVS